jgi:cysteine desulfurase
MPYFDHAATTSMVPEVQKLFVEHLTQAANPSSIHNSGRKARAIVEVSREQIGRALKTHPSHIYFTAGGTEADNLAVKGLYWSRQKDKVRPRILVSAIEHHAVLDPAHWLEKTSGAIVELIPVNQKGVIDLDELTKLIAKNETDVALIAVMWANNEVGSVQPIEEIAKLANAHQIPLHVDAVQAIGSLEIDLSRINLDSLAISGHKIGAPHATGLLVLRNGFKVDPVLHGGNQEPEVRSGTINTAGAAALGLAVELAVAKQAQHAARLQALRDKLIKEISSLVPDCVVNGDLENRLPGNTHFSFFGASGDSILMLLDQQGIEVSTGSACSAGVAQPSHVLMAMGVDLFHAISSVRITLGTSTTETEVNQLITKLPEAVATARLAGLNVGKKEAEKE